MATNNTSDSEGWAGEVGALAWGDLHPSVRAEQQDLLIAWLRDVLVPGWPVATEPLVSHACLPHHPDVVLSLRAIASLYQLEMYPEGGEDGSPGAAKLTGILDWESELGKASERWAASFRQCNKGCDRLCPPEHARKWVAAMVQAAAVAWNRGAPDPMRALEPWEAVADVSNYEHERSGDLADEVGTPDMFREEAQL